MAIDCPTTGFLSGAQVELVIRGAGLIDPTVTIGGRTATVKHSSDPSVVTVLLPEGFGVARDVVVVSRGYLSAAAPLVSYAEPEVIGISGCSSEELTTTLKGCPKESESPFDPDSAVLPAKVCPQCLEAVLPPSPRPPSPLRLDGHWIFPTDLHYVMLCLLFF